MEKRTIYLTCKRFWQCFKRFQNGDCNVKESLVKFYIKTQQCMQKLCSFGVACPEVSKYIIRLIRLTFICQVWIKRNKILSVEDMKVKMAHIVGELTKKDFQYCFERFENFEWKVVVVKKEICFTVAVSLFSSHTK